MQINSPINVQIACGTPTTGQEQAQASTTAAVQQSNALLAQVVDRLDRLEAVTTQGVRASGSSALRASLNR
ncbi:hypothetical protein [Stenotrophomonas maltophilia]|uniref:Uncharacterized protein n=1 Tax=Stenotrophomonas maltophilia TaxID=40324 RepID=A0A2J0UGU9_STEMA|nr:hypothetical protein [Stenotrophomonas maltophilia]PJL34078.1 hypothetical protein B9Y64_03005 [Stenotrophomonas maltophilia]